MILVIDNYDSFSYNLYQMIGELNPDIRVIRNDEMTVDEIRDLAPDHIILSPGPGRPEDAGVICDVAASIHDIPVLGVCLGHQAIGEAFGGKLENLSDVFHGVATPCHIIADDPIFSGIERDITIGRYHSWVVSKENFPDCLEVTAVSDEGQIMALRHRELNIRGIQFHPESVLTLDGKKMLQNWMFL